MRTWMSERELKRAAVFSRVAEKAWTLVQGAERMEVSYRQAKRLWKRYRAEGSAGLVHGNVGRASNRAKPKSLRRRVLNLIRKRLLSIMLCLIVSLGSLESGLKHSIKLRKDGGDATSYNFPAAFFERRDRHAEFKL